MLELLRAVDQREMDAHAFRAFLREGGMPADTIARQVQGAADIELTSGPHLDRFNRRISLPELTDAVGVMAALCMEGRHRLDVKIDGEVADSDRSLITQQVANGVVVRMAVLFHLLGPGQFDTDDPETDTAAPAIEDLNLVDTAGVDNAADQAPLSTDQMEEIT